MYRTYEVEDDLILTVIPEDGKTIFSAVNPMKNPWENSNVFIVKEDTLRNILNSLVEDRTSQRPFPDSYDVDDIVLDRDSDAWLFDGKVWTSVFAVSDRELTTEELLESYGPLRLAHIKEK